jgi:CheY-like chemotaxis protein
VRDFFLTLFFVALGMKMPWPSARLMLLTAAVGAFVVASRFVVVFPVFRLLRLDPRTAGVVGINLAQVSEFSLVIVSLGLGYGHVSREIAALVLYALLGTSVAATYAILFNHAIASAMARTLTLAGLRSWWGTRSGPAEPAEARVEPPQIDVFMLGVCQEGLAFLRRLDLVSAAHKPQIVAVDFNPETLAQLAAAGVTCHYGDIGNAETLRHAGIEHAAVVVSSISDWFLQGTDNLRLLRQVRALAPAARIIVTADSPASAERLYAAGAHYVLIPPVLTAEHLYELLVTGGPQTLAEARDRQSGAQGLPPAPSRTAANAPASS